MASTNVSEKEEEIKEAEEDEDEEDWIREKGLWERRRLAERNIKPFVKKEEENEEDIEGVIYIFHRIKLCSKLPYFHHCIQNSRSVPNVYKIFVLILICDDGLREE